MNTSLFASVVNAWLLAGWTMVHFLWLGTLVALVAFLSRWLLRRASANIRYVTALACLALLAALPIVIATWLHEFSPPLQAENSRLGDADSGRVVSTEQVRTAAFDHNAPIDLAAPQPIQMSVTPAEPTPITAQPLVATNDAPKTATAAPAARDALSLVVFAINSSVRYLPWLWLIGTPITFALTATGVVGTRRLRRASRPITEGPIAELLVRLAASLRLGKRVTIAVCDRIAAPVLIGILRPIILFPPAALTGYSPDEIEMVLLHELAHVRRWDNLINLLQRLIESLLFFHPAVWLVSSWVRREREACCDALVVARTDHPHAYAELLVALAAQMPRSVLFHPAASSAMAAGPLRSRIRRILQLDDDPMLISGRSFALMLGALLTAAALAVLYLPTVGQAEQSTTKGSKNAESKAQANKSSASSDEEQVFATFPADGIRGNRPQEFLDAYAAAEKKKIHTELVLRDEKALLIVTPLPTEKDWPAILGNPPRKERVIADKAWQRLGLKLVPLSEAEAMYRSVMGKPLGVMIVGGNLPKGLPVPSILTKVDGTSPDNMDYLLAWIESESGQSQKSVKCYAMADEKEYLFEAQPPNDTKPATPSEPAPDPTRSALSSRRFPSLEDQKLADLVWKRLKLEMEPIGEVDLKRVKAFGYDGGMLLTDIGYANKDSVVQGQFSDGDILVGLHVWPTRNMKEVAEVLNRPDLAELSPLKFYVVRRESVGTIANPEQTQIEGDVVHTGRISVNLQEAEFGGGGESPSRPRPQKDPFQSKVQETTPKSISMAEQGRILEMQRAEQLLKALGQQVEAATKAKQEALAKREQAKDHDAIEEAKRKLEVADRQLEDVKRFHEEVKRQYEKLQRQKDERPSGDQASATTNPPPPIEQDSTSPLVASHPNVVVQKPTGLSTTQFANVAAAKSALCYDGKTFDEWQTAWRTELSTEKRLEAVKALAAFGANGYGREAAEAILEVAGQYDWKSIGANKAVESLKNACVEALGGIDVKISNERTVAQSIAASNAIPALFAAAKSGNRQQKLFLTYVLPWIPGPESVGLLLALSKDKDPTVRQYALRNLPCLGMPDHDEKVSARIREALKSNESDDVVAAMHDIFPYRDKSGASAPYPYLPELTKAIFSPQEAMRKQGRNLSSGLQGDDAAHVVEAALAVLKDNAKKQQHLEAIRALAALGPAAKPAVDTLRPLVKSDDQPIAIAAAEALKRMLKQPEYAKLLYEELGERFNLGWSGRVLQLPGGEKQEEFNAFERAVRDEEMQLFP